jgi:hypothetical protein
MAVKSFTVLAHASQNMKTFRDLSTFLFLLIFSLSSSDVPRGQSGKTGFYVD